MFMPFSSLKKKKNKQQRPPKTAYENASCEPSKTTYSARQLITDIFLKGFKNEWE